MAEAPSGTVTFLFTDIEGSTRLWERSQERMQSVLARHDALLREGIERQGGYVFKTIGDAFCAAFPAAPEALTAALHLQRALSGEEALASLRVRMALHTGAAEQRDGDYFGPPLNRVSRLLSAGHGGQVLLSEVTQGLVRDALPVGANLRSLGEHRLKDLTRPEHVFQFTAPDLLSDFPPLRTLEARPHNLPLQRTPLIGREQELRTLTQMLLREEVPLLTLTVPGGTGKTRLALQAAAELLEQFEDGVFFVGLAPLSDPALVPSAVAQALGVRESAERPLAETLPEYLRERQLLLVLDNLEQVTGAAPFVSRLLASAPGVKVLATSRVPLHLRGEQEHPVPPLSLPDPKRLPPLERLTQYETVRLFVERARGVKPNFTVTNENAAAVAEICHRLDGLPLAIELAAARVRILPPQALLARLQNRLALLTGGARDLPERQQTLRGAIEWSFELLGEEERVLFRRLAAFAGGRTLEAIESVCNADGGLDVLDGVSSLVEKSLLRQEEDAEDEPRFVMLETLHEYASEKLQESAEAEEIRSRHAAFFLALAEEAEPQLTGPEQGRWLARLEVEHENLRAALRHLLQSGDAERAGRLAGALWSFWRQRGHLREGRDWLAQVLASEHLSPRTRARALSAAGVLAWNQQDYAAAGPHFEQSLSLWRTLEDTSGIARALNGLGIVASEQGDLARAEALFEEAATRWRAAGEKWALTMVLNNLGEIARQRQDHARAEALYRESLALARETGDLRVASIALANLGDLARQQGDLSGAGARLRESLQLALEAGSSSQATDVLSILAQVESARRQWERAARLFGAVEAHLRSVGSNVPPEAREAYERDLSATRAALGGSAWERLAQQGAAMNLEEAIALALQESG
ncbi:MAG: ATP-binding protein [Longimicrobiaceae bacterium]